MAAPKRNLTSYLRLGSRPRSVMPDNFKKYLSLNLARTGGTSLGQVLIDSFGDGEVVTDYGTSAVYDRMGHLEPSSFLKFLTELDASRRERVRVFLGHLPFLDRSQLPFESEYIVFMRNPVDKIISGFTYGNLARRRIQKEFLAFGLHLSCTCETPRSFSNPMLQVLLGKEEIDDADTHRIDELLQAIGQLGVTEQFEWSCERLLRSLGKQPLRGYHHLNKSFKVRSDEIPDVTIRAIKRKNAQDILLYNRVCEILNIDRKREGLAALPLCDVTSEGPFSSGDYHPELSCESAFGGPLGSAWLSSNYVLPSAREFIGYDFGPNEKRAVNNVRLQLVGASDAPVAFAIEASNDGFAKQTDLIRVFEATADGKCHSIYTGANGHVSRMWRLRRVSDRATGPVAIAALSFTPDPPILCKQIDLVRLQIERILATFNVKTYAKALDRGERLT